MTTTWPYSTEAHHLTCPRCSEAWDCHCGKTPCLFETSLCDDCQLEHLEAEDEAGELCDDCKAYEAALG